MAISIHFHNLMLTGTLCFIACFSCRLTAQTFSPDVLNLTLQPGLISSKPHYIIQGHPGFLHPESKISGGDYKDSLTQFTLALIDYNGDGIYNQTGVDRLALTVYQDRILRINNEYGTPCIVLDESNPEIFIDSIGFRITEITENGTAVRMKRVGAERAENAKLKVETWLPDVAVNTFFSKKMKFSDYLHRGKLVYIYFFNSRELEYQLKKLEVIFTKYSDKVSIAGLYLPFSEPLDVEISTDFLLKMATPWPQGICEHDLYRRLGQDMAYYRGILAGEDGRIREISISPKELLEKLESLYGTR